MKQVTQTLDTPICPRQEVWGQPLDPYHLAVSSLHRLTSRWCIIDCEPSPSQELTSPRVRQIFESSYWYQPAKTLYQCNWKLVKNSSSLCTNIFSVEIEIEKLFSIIWEGLVIYFILTQMFSVPYKYTKIINNFSYVLLLFKLLFFFISVIWSD